MDDFNNLQNQLDSEIDRLFNLLSTMNPESEEYSKTAKQIQGLYELRQKDDRTYFDHFEKINQRELEENSKKEELKEKRKDRIWKIVMGCLELGIPLVFYGTFMHRGFKFEETGSYTSRTFSNLISRFKPTK